ncbi:MAG: 4Fe-4S binding protein, partial [Candidatus Tenebribacter mawsonii]|nr:4Fe-4S binding protein [Candidatus Tenebribacter mawsonii]
NLKAETDLKKWQTYIEDKKKIKTKNKEETFKIVKNMVEGFDNLTETFSNCIGCHNCSSSCPICYCRQCYFDSSVAKPNSDVIMMRAEDRGAVSLPLDRIMFHTGRMAHMSLSCVSCGLCSDACPVNIPVAKIFSFVASQTQKTFDYQAGASAGDALPMKEYKLDELGELGELVKSAEAQEGGNE